MEQTALPAGGSEPGKEDCTRRGLRELGGLGWLEQQHCGWSLPGLGRLGALCPEYTFTVAER